MWSSKIFLKKDEDRDFSGSLGRSKLANSLVSSTLLMRGKEAVVPRERPESFTL